MAGFFIRHTRVNGTTLTKHLLTISNINITYKGYIYVWVSNESNANLDVFFDDLKITHTKGAILQEDHYYPFGANISALSSTAPLSKPNKFKYNGNEEQTDFDLNLYDFNARMYDATLGRFISVDRLADNPKQYNQSPYQFGWNNPIKLNDPTGNCPRCPRPDKAMYAVAEGFRQYFKAGLKSIDNAYLEVSASISNVINEAKINLGFTESKVETTATSSASLRASTNFEEFFSLPIDNKPRGPAFIFGVETSHTLDATISVSEKITPMTDVTVSNTVSVNAVNGEASNTSEVVVGVKGNGVFLSNTQSSNGSQTDVGVKASGGVSVLGYQINVGVKAATTIKEKENEN